MLLRHKCFSRLLLLSTLASVGIAGAGVVSAADRDHWTGWLGPDRNGRVAGISLPQPLPETLSVAWKKEVGTGYGSPLYVGDQIFVHTRVGDQEVVWCLHKQDARVRWRKSYDVPFRPGGGGEWHGRGPKSSPVYRDGRIFTMSILGDLSAWSADDGTLLWRSDFSETYQPNRPYWGVATSPVVAGEAVIAHFGNDDQGTLAALDVATGRPLWTSGTAGTSYSSPLVATLHSVPQVIEWNHESLTGIDLKSGDQLWSVPFAHDGSNQNMPTPVLNNGRIFLGAENRGLHAYEPTLQNGAWTVRRIWSNDKVALDMSTAVAQKDLLFGLSHYGKGRLFCVDASTGKILWQSPGRVGRHTSMLVVDDSILTLTDRGSVQLIHATGKDYQVEATWQVSDQPTWAPPVLTPEGLLIKDQTTLRLLKF